MNEDGLALWRTVDSNPSCMRVVVATGAAGGDAGVLMLTAERVEGKAGSMVGDIGLMSILRDGEISDPIRVIAVVSVFASASEPFTDRDWGVRDNLGAWLETFEDV